MMYETVSETILISDKGFRIYLTKKGNSIILENNRQNDDFHFINENNEDTRKKWETMGKMIVKASKIMETL